MPLNQIKKGEYYDFSFDREGEDIAGWVCTINLKQYPDDTSTIKRTITPTNDKWSGTLSNNDTKNLNVGQYLLIANLTKGTEKEVKTDRIYIGKSW